MRLSDYIHPYIGSVGHLLTSTHPVVTLPHGMMKFCPAGDGRMRDAYLTGSISGFPLGVCSFMTVGGPSDYDHDLEWSKVSSYSVLLLDNGVRAEAAVTRHGGILRFTSDKSISLCVSQTASFRIEGNRLYSEGKYGNAKAYGFYELDGATFITEDGTLIASGGNAITVRGSVSQIDEAQAIFNFEHEVAGRSFEEISEACAAEWDELLGRITVSGVCESDKAFFYTAMYRVFMRQNCYSEYGRHFCGYDGKVHDDEGHEFYADDGVWDTHRGAHPLQTLIEPKLHEDILESFIRGYERSGWLHDFPNQAGGRPCMLGSHVTTLFANALAHGESFDIQRAYKAVRFAHFEGSLLPWYIGPETELDRCYRERGFFPALAYGEEETVPEVHSFERRQAVAVTLEQAYDDCCAAVLADEAGFHEDAEILRSRADNYKNVFDKDIGFMAPRDISGEFVRPFDPKLASAQGGRDSFAECNSWVYTMEVRHDTDGLCELLGSREKLLQRLRDMFTEPCNIPKFKFLSLFPDSTGLMGQFCAGNEPGFHIPYMFACAGSPWETQRKVREVEKLWFTDHPLGICGDEDGGAMSAWFVFSALGFYPYCVGDGNYVIGTPLFDRSEITLGNGKKFTVIASGASEGKKYIKSAQLNGTELNRCWFSGKELLAGGELIFEMSELPCREWASGEAGMVPSMNKIKK